MLFIWIVFLKVRNYAKSGMITARNIHMQKILNSIRSLKRFAIYWHHSLIERNGQIFRVNLFRSEKMTVGKVSYIKDGSSYEIAIEKRAKRVVNMSHII